MTLEQLRIFIAVAEREHLTRASEALNLTQSAVSSAIAALEARYGTKLFDRIGRGIALTEAGRLFLPEARAVLARVRAALSDCSDIERITARVCCRRASPRDLVALARSLGTLMAAGVVLALIPSGDDYRLIPDLDQFVPLQPGAYRLEPEGETAVDPDFRFASVIHLPPPEFEEPAHGGQAG